MSKFIRKIEKIIKQIIPYGLVMIEQEYKKYKKYISFKDFCYFYFSLFSVKQKLFFDDHINNRENVYIFTYENLIQEAKKIYGDENKIFIIIDKENRYEESNVISLSEFRKVQENSIKKYLFCRPEQHTSEGLGKLSNILWNNNIYAPFYITKEVVSPGLKGNINPNFVYENIVSIIKILKKLEDRESKKVFLSICKTLLGNPGNLGFSSYPQYEHPIVSARQDDIVVDGGLLDGVVTAMFACKVGGKGKVFGFEPVKKFYFDSKAYCKNYKNCYIENFGLWSEKMKFTIHVPLADGAGGGASLEHDIYNSIDEECEAISIDEYFVNKEVPCNLIKLDIEGAEYQCLLGAHNTIMKFHPKLQISLYHHLEDHIRIPMLIMEKYPWYKMYLGHHTIFDNEETVLYCI